MSVALLGEESTCTCLYPSCGPEGTHCRFCGHLWPRHQIGGRRRGQHYGRRVESFVGEDVAILARLLVGPRRPA